MYEPETLMTGYHSLLKLSVIHYQSVNDCMSMFLVLYIHQLWYNGCQIPI